MTDIKITDDSGADFDSDQADDLIEPCPIADIYADGIGRVEKLGGGNRRLTLFTVERGQRVIVAKIVHPIEGFDLRLWREPVRPRGLHQ